MTDSIHSWSKTAADNAASDDTINWREFQSPDTVNNSSRAEMARVAEWRDDLSIARVTTGAAPNAYEATSASTPTALVDGLMVMIRPHQNTDGNTAASFKLNSFPPKPLRARTNVELLKDEIQAGAPMLVMYDLSGDEWLAINTGYMANQIFPSLISKYTLNSLVPTGGVIAWGGGIVPLGWLECNGATVSQIEYPELFAKIGLVYGNGGANTFNLPDYRGEFLRGWDHGRGADPDSAARTDRGDGTTGDAVGTRQVSVYGAHVHGATTETETVAAGAHVHNVARGQTAVSPSGTLPVQAVGNTVLDPTSTDGSHSHSASSTTTIAFAGGDETRPLNVNVTYIIYAKPSEAIAEMQGLTGLPYQWSAQTTVADPGDGFLGWDNADISLITKIFVSATGPNDQDFAPILEVWDDIGSEVRGYLYITKVGTPTTFAYITLNSAQADNSGWSEWTVTGITQDGTFEQGDNVNVIFSPVGAGTDGAKGDPGVTAGLRYAFGTSTDTTVDPGTGTFTFDNADPSMVSEMAISYVGIDPANYEDLIGTWDDSTSTDNLGQLMLKREDAVENYVSYRIVSATINQGTYGQVRIQYQDSSGTFADGDLIGVEYSRTGDKGASGTGSGDMLGVNNLNDVQSAEVSRANLGVEIDVDVQRFDDTLVAWSFISPNDKEDTQTFATQAEMEEGTLADLRSMSPLLVSQAIDAQTGGDGVETASLLNIMVNGTCRTSQQNGVSAGTSSGYFPCDQFEMWHSQGGSTSIVSKQAGTPAGNVNKIAMTVVSPTPVLGASQFCLLWQKIEGTTWNQLQWGTGNAKPLLVRFGCNWPAGTYCLSVRNGNSDRSYVTDFVTDGTDQVFEILIPGDTSGTWPTGAVSGASIVWSYAAGTALQGPADAWQDAVYIATANQTNGLASGGAEFETFDIGAYSDPLSTGKAAPYIIPPITEEVAQCERYYQQGTYYWTGTVTTGQSYGGTAEFRTVTRGVPVITQQNASSSGAVGNVPGQTAVDRVSYTSLRAGTGNNVAAQWYEAYQANSRM